MDKGCIGNAVITADEIIASLILSENSNFRPVYWALKFNKAHYEHDKFGFIIRGYVSTDDS